MEIHGSKIAKRLHQVFLKPNRFIFITKFVIKTKFKIKSDSKSTVLVQG